MGDWKSHCEVLGLPESASEDEIRSAFRRLALETHPDRNGGSTIAKERFQRLVASYRYLLDNVAYRPAAPSASVPPSLRPPPIPANRRRESIRAGRPQPPIPISKPGPPRGKAIGTHRLPKIPPRILRKLPAAAVALALTLSVLDFVDRRFDVVVSGRSPASSTPVGQCKLLSFRKGGVLAAKRELRASEFDCDLACHPWAEDHRTENISCSWNGDEFRNVAALTNPPPEATTAPPAAPRAGLRDDGYYDDPTPSARAEFVYGEEMPETDKSVPIAAEEVRLWDTPHLNTFVTPKIWISDEHLMVAKGGTSRLKVSLTPLRAGEVTVLITDKIDRPIRKILYTIH
jgi:hypothetical protein